MTAAGRRRRPYSAADMPIVFNLVVGLTLHDHEQWFTGAFQTRRRIFARSTGQSFYAKSAVARTTRASLPPKATTPAPMGFWPTRAGDAPAPALLKNIVLRRGNSTSLQRNMPG